MKKLFSSIAAFCLAHAMRTYTYKGYAEGIRFDGRMLTIPEQGTAILTPQQVAGIIIGYAQQYGRQDPKETLIDLINAGYVAKYPKTGEDAGTPVVVENISDLAEDVIRSALKDRKRDIVTTVSVIDTYLESRDVSILDEREVKKLQKIVDASADLNRFAKLVHELFGLQVKGNYSKAGSAESATIRCVVTKNLQSVLETENWIVKDSFEGIKRVSATEQEFILVHIIPETTTSTLA